MWPLWLAFFACAEPEVDRVDDGAPEVQDPPPEVEAVRLVVQHAPGELAVGADGRIDVVASRGTETLPVTEVAYRSSDTSLLEVSADGQLRARAEGTAWVTLEGHGATALVEVQITP